MPIRSSWLILLYKSYIALLIFCLLLLSIIARRALKCPTVIVDLSISPSSPIRLCLIYFEALLLSASMFRFTISSWRMEPVITKNELCLWPATARLIWDNYSLLVRQGLSASSTQCSMSYKGFPLCPVEIGIVADPVWAPNTILFNPSGWIFAHHLRTVSLMHVLVSTLLDFSGDLLQMRGQHLLLYSSRCTFAPYSSQILCSVSQTRGTHWVLPGFPLPIPCPRNSLRAVS